MRTFLPASRHRAAALLFSAALLILSACVAQETPRRLPDAPADPPAFPRADYTPFGYLDNPFHSMVYNRSGIVRSVPPLGFGWWRTEFEGEYGGGAKGHINYVSFMEMAVRIGDDCFLKSEDFAAHGAELVSRYHSKQMMSYDWSDSSVAVRLKFFLPRENTLSCIAEFSNAGARAASVTLYATTTYGLGDVRWWGSDGLVARPSQDGHALVSKIWAYGDVFALASTETSAFAFCSPSEKEWEERIRTDDTTPVRAVSVRGRGPVRAMQAYIVRLAPGNRKSILVCLSRGKNETDALDELRSGLAGSVTALTLQLGDDQRFWSGCPALDGDWPETWKRGWVYDFETLRMNVRRPLGIFRHPWDAMQIHAPRVVLGETCLDMMTMSYADPALARDVLLGTFEDARQPNIPCAREDGSVNMISSDGSECGTAPMWGYPFHVIRSIYRSTGDAHWVTALYPRLKAYIDWWLAHRTDSEGWLHCNNSWESGQDGSKRFIVSEGNEGAVADFVRTVDVEASMAEAMEIMEEFARVAGRPQDVTMWRAMAERRVTNVRAMFADGWFRDVDGRTNTPIVLENPYDVAMLSPFACNVATSGQVDIVRPRFEEFPRLMAPWLQWPPAMQTFVEASWNVGAQMEAAGIVATTADRVYRRTDARVIPFGEADDPLSIRLPGVANEFWPLDNVRPGGEAYGWGATLPIHILRAIVGFRERSSPPEADFYLSPSIPPDMAADGKTYTVKNLRFRTMQFDVTYRCRGSSELGIELRFRSQNPAAISIRREDGNSVLAKSRRSRDGILTIDGMNGGMYVVRCE